MRGSTSCHKGGSDITILPFWEKSNSSLYIDIWDTWPVRSPDLSSVSQSYSRHTGDWIYSIGESHGLYRKGTRMGVRLKLVSWNPSRYPEKYIVFPVFKWDTTRINFLHPAMERS